MMHEFDPKKALEVAVYLSGRSGEFYEFMGTLYLANKLHLFRHGRSITSDTYTTNTLQGVSMTALLIDASSPETENPALLRSEQDLRRSILVPTRDADMRFLSVSEVECIDQIIEVLSALSDIAVREIFNSELDALVDMANSNREVIRTRKSSHQLFMGVNGITDVDVAETMSRKPEGLARYIESGE